MPGRISWGRRPHFVISRRNAPPPPPQNNGAQQLASEATIYIVLDDVNDEIPLFTEREQETVLEGEPPGTKVTQVNAIDKDGTFPNKQVSRGGVKGVRVEGGGLGGKSLMVVNFSGR